MQLKQQQQQTFQGQQMGGVSQPQVNGAMPSTASSSEGQAQAAQSVGAAMANGGSQAQMQFGLPSATPVPTAQAEGSAEPAFSKEQVGTLRAQVQAFGHLQKNLPIPQAVQDRIFPSRQEHKPPAMNDAVAAMSNVLDDAAKTPGLGAKSTADPQGDGRPRHRFETFSDPHSLMLKRISYADHTNRADRLMIPSIMPLGVDAERVREERENIIHNRVLARRNELAKVSANIGAWDTVKSDVPQDNANLKLRALIEYLSLIHISEPTRPY